MSELKEANMNPAAEPEEDETVKKIKVRVSLFFDGTLNNRINVKHRIDASMDPRAKALFDKYGKDGSSYHGDFTNVAKMEKYIDDAKDYDVSLGVYTEGPGTKDDKGDHTRGYALGTGSTGVHKKVEKGITEAVNKATDSVGDKETVIELLTIDVFGFSRGAAGARLCIYEVLNGKRPIKELLADEGYDVRRVEVCFAGLYDTVSSHGIVYSNDVGDLKLRSVALAKRTVQLAAAEEHRKNFSLTDITSAGRKKGLQVFLPGVHSDIGGGYKPNGSENGMGVYYSLSEHDAESERRRLINAGWYRDNEINVVCFPAPASGLGGGGFDQYVIEVNRSGINNTYSLVPFNLMADHAVENGISLSSEVKAEKVPAALSTVDQEIRSYVQKQGNRSRAEDWLGDDKSWHRALRHDYLHFSARLEFAHNPRFKEYRRFRKTYHG